MNPAFASTTDGLFHKGNAAFFEGRYQEAIQDYESLLQQGYVSAPLFYNLANAYFRDGKSGLAILNYERALWLNPRDADTQANLKFARKKVGIFENSSTWWQDLPRILSLNAWLWLTLFMWFLASFLLILKILKWSPWSGWNLRPAILINVILLLLCVAASAIRMQDLRRHVVTASDVSLLVAPLENSPKLVALQEGLIVEVKKRQGTFLYVRAETGKQGWIAETQIQSIVP